MDIIYIDDTDSDEEDAIVKEVLRSAPVARAQRPADRFVRWPQPPPIPRVTEERLHKEKPDPSPIAVRPIAKVAQRDTARELFRREGGFNPPKTQLESPNKPSSHRVDSPTKVNAPDDVARELFPDDKARAQKPTAPSRRSSDLKATTASPSSQCNIMASPLMSNQAPSAPSARTRLTTHAATQASARAASCAPSTQSTPDPHSDSDSDYTQPTKKTRKDQLRRQVPAQQHVTQVQLQPMFDTFMALVWKRDHHDQQRMLKTHGEQPQERITERQPPPPYPRARRSLASSSDEATRRPLHTAMEDPKTHLGGQLTPAEWPPSIPRLAANYNPTSIRFPSIKPEGMCSCDLFRVGDCRYQSCQNARDGIFCDVYCCPFSGNCGNGKRESSAIRLMKVVGAETFTIQATKRIEAGVTLGEYFGELSLETGERRQRSENEGFRLHFHRDHDAWGPAVVCVNALLAGSLMRFLNHSCTPCTAFHEMANGRQRTIVVTTVRVIEAGEEITADYGDELWFTCRCERCVEAGEHSE